MSLIESALEKLRRGAEAGAQPGAVSRPATIAADRPRGPAVVVTPAPEAAGPPRRITIDLKALRDAGYLPEEGLERRFADYYRHIKRPLIEKALAGGAEMRLIMISSPLPGDGKTFTSINLAFSMARERDVTVLLVDADAPKAQTSEVLGIRAEPGLFDALADPSLNVESLIEGTDVRGLEILPTGKLVENAPELLASARMREIAARLSARNRRLVLFDCVPLLVSSEARVLMRIAGQIVLVARSGATPRRAVADALTQIDKNKLQGLILNRTPFWQAGPYNYGYSGYDKGNEEPFDSA